MDLGSALSPALGGSPALALAPELLLKAPELCPGQFGKQPDDLLYHPPPSSLCKRTPLFYTCGSGSLRPAPFRLPARCRLRDSSSTRPHLKRASNEKYC